MPTNIAALSNLRHVDNAAELVLCGHTDEWTASIIEALESKLHLVDHLSIHRYWIEGGPESTLMLAVVC